MHEPGQGGQHLLGGGRVERRGRLVEHEQPRVHREHRTDRDPLLLPAGERPQVAAPQVGDAEQVERLLDPAAHRRRLQPELLHPVGQLLLDRVGDEAGDGVLADEPDRVRPLARRRLAGCCAVEQDVAAAASPPVNRGTSPVTTPSSVDLPTPVGPETTTSSPSSRSRSTSASTGRVVVAERDVAQRDHDVTCHGRGAAAAPATAGSRRRPRRPARARRRRRDGVERRVGDRRAGCRPPSGPTTAVTTPEATTASSGQRQGSGR